jgi:formylglycine-generating enzyme required for sulfatase activity/serine/threonine protein kinase
MDELDPTIPLPPPSDSPRTGSPPSKSKGWQPPSTEELQAQLPQYEITALLGRGGMGAVYKGTQKNLDRPVAIKILPPDMDEDDSGANFTERFKNEARAMAKLSHPGIVAVFDFGETADGLLYIVMEFIEGTDVQKMVSEQGRLHSEHAMAITAHVCDALRYAHERGIIHRDIKPANIMVGYDGVVKVADFGLAKIDQGGTSGLTRSGMAMGTLHYMAPEALMLGSSVDQRADIYAVGVMLYYMLTGKLPQGMFELPSLQVPGLDPRYDGIIAKALRDDRSIRYQSTADLRRDLDAILTQPVVKVEPGTREAQPALPTDVRPQRPEGRQRVDHRSPERIEIRVERRSPPLLWVAALVLGGFATWSVWFRPKTATSEQPVTATAHAGPDVPPPSIPVPDTSPISSTAGSPASSLPPPQANMLPSKSGPVANTPPPAATKLVPPVPPTTAAGKVLNALPATGWRSMITDMAWLQKQPGITLLPDGWLRLEQTAIPLGRSKNVVIRSKVKRAIGVTQAYTPLRWSTEVDGSQTHLRAVIVRGASLAIGRASTDLKQPGWSNRGLTDQSLPQPQDDGEHELAFAAIGSTISAYWDGKLVATVQDASCQGDQFGLHAIHPAMLKDPEWLPLDESGNPVPTEIVAPSNPAAPALPKTFRLGSSVVTKDKPFVNSIGMRFVPVPGTKVLMCVHPTRKRDFAEFAATDASLPTFWQYRHPQTMRETEVNLCPASNVSWVEAKAFCDWLGRKEGHAYRMPTDREWSFAVGIGNLENESETPRTLSEGVKGVFAWGTQWPPPDNAANLADTSAAKIPGQQLIPGFADGYAYLSPVMSFQPNDLGIYDLAGNVSEWCEDWVDEQKQQRTMRGGAFNLFLPNILLASHRNQNLPERRSPNYGFRCVIELPDSSVASPSVSNIGPSARTAAAPATAHTSGTSYEWIDGKGRRITAGFVRTDNTTVVIRTNGKEVPVPLSSLSEESRQLASRLAAASVPDKAKQDAPFTNSLGMKFVPVPGTKVLFGIHETRRKDFETFCSETGYSSAYWHSQPNGLLAGHEADHPVVGVSWNDAQSFCSWLTQKTGITHRLPTDHEWSCAVGVGDEEAKTPDATPEQLNLQIQNEYPWGRSFPPPDHSGNLADRECGKMFSNQTVLFSYNDGFATTAPVMSFKPNAFGIYDLEGNVSEWCSDLHNDKMQFRVFRGGHWLASAPNILMSSARMRNTVIAHVPTLGFRVVMEPTP